MLYFRLRDPRIPVKSTSSAFAAGREVKGLTGLFLTLIFQGLNLAERLIFRKRRGAMATISAHFKKVFFYVYPISAIVIIFLAQTPPAGAGPEESTTHGKDISTQQRIPPYVVAVNGEAFVLDQNSDGIKVTSVKTSLPVFKAFCLANDQKTLLYMPLRNGIPSGELYVEDLLTGDLKKISSHLVLEAACSPTNSNEVAYTFSGGDAFGLATLGLVSGNVRTLLPSGVLADFLQWDDSGKGIYYFQVIGGDQPILDSISFKVMEVKPYTVLSPRYISVKTGTSQEVLPSDLPAGFPVLNSPIIPGLFSQPVTEEKAGLPENLYSFRTFSPDRSYEVFGDNLLGSGGLYVRSLQTGDTRPIGEGKVLKILQTGIVVKVFNAAGAEFQFIAWNGKTTWLGATAVSYNLPLKSFLVTQGGQSYPPPGNCQIFSHFSSSGSGYAYDMQSSRTGAHVLASAAGLVVYARSSVNCNVCDDGSDETVCVDYFSGNCPSAGDYQLAGNTVIIQHADGSYTQYAHMQPNSVQVSVGSNVCQGLYIGNQGHTGCTKGRMNGCGDHLHFQRQSSSVPSGPSISISFSDAPSNPLYCSISYTSGSTEVTSCAQPNLTPYQPSGWSDKIVVSKTTGTNTDSSPLYTTDTLYVDWAVINNGTAATTTTYYTTLYVDGVARQSWPTSPPHNPNFYVSVTDYSIGTLSAGTHTIKIVTDATGVVAESNEGDNEYTKTITVTTPPPSASITAKDVFPSTITLGQSFTVSVTGKNNGGTAGWGGISVSFPQLVSTGSCPGSSYSGSEATVTGSSTTLSLGFHHKGCPISSSGGSMSAQYLLAEGSKSSWGSNESHSMTLTVTPKVTGTFTVYIRMALCQASCSSSPISRDPTSGSPTDQQGYAVYSFSVTVNPPSETVSTPSTPTGPTSGTTGTSYTYATGGSVSNQGHSVQYLIDWGDGSNSNWLPVGTTSAPKSWSSAGTYCVKAKARCATHTSVESGWSGCLYVTISTAPTAGVLSVNPSDGLSSSGNQGGPFTPSSKTYTLQNTGGTSINWTASKGQAWVSLSSTGGTLAAGASTTVTVSINSNANSLTPGTYSDIVSFTNTTNGNGNTTRPVSLTVNPTASVPLGEAVDNASLTWTTGGNANWYGQNTVYYYGGDAARSGAITHNQSSWIQTTVTGPGTLTFYWKVSSESGWDFLHFYIDGVEQTKISGEVDWQQRTYSIPSGSHILTWAYTKDDIISMGSDAGWLDYVVFMGGPTTRITVTSPNGGEIWQAGTTRTISWTYTGSPGSAVKIELYKGGVFHSPITSSTSIGSGSYNWTIPSTQTPGTDYKIKVTSTTNGAYYDYSDNNFTIIVDTTPPTNVQVTAPTSGQVVSGTFTFKATAQDNSGTVQKVEFYVDSDTAPACTDSTAKPSGSTFQCNWNTASKPNGSHTVRAKAYDPSGYSAFSSLVSFTINNVVSDTTPPTNVQVTSPVSGQTISGTFTLRGTAQDNSGTIQKMEFYIDSDTSPACSDTTPKASGSTFQCNWNTANKPNGSHTVRAKAYDPSGNPAFSSSVSFTINNSTTPINRLLNPSFESGPAYWVQHSSTGYNIITNLTLARARTGSWYAWFGSTNNVSEYIYQDVTIPANATVANVEFWYQVVTDETSTSTCNDKLVVEVRRPSDNALLATLTTLCNYHRTTIWTRSGPFSVLSFKGQTVRLRFYMTTNSLYATSFFVDDVALIADGN